jgi:hypothetical protein
MDASRVAGGFTFDNTNDTLTIPVDGLYDLDGCIYWSGSGSWYATGFINRLRSAATLTVAASDLHLHAGTIDARSHWAGRKVPLKAGDVVSLSAYNYTGGAADCRVSASSEALGCSLTITYVSPLNGATPL